MRQLGTRRGAGPGPPLRTSLTYILFSPKPSNYQLVCENLNLYVRASFSRQGGAKIRPAPWHRIEAHCREYGSEIWEGVSLKIGRRDLRIQDYPPHSFTIMDLEMRILVLRGPSDEPDAIDEYFSVNILIYFFI